VGQFKESKNGDPSPTVTTLRFLRIGGMAAARSGLVIAVREDCNKERGRERRIQ